MGQPPLESTIQIAATPDEVWAAVSDVKAMSRRSPELVGMWLFGRPQVGRRGINLNRRKGFVWPTFSRVVQWKPPANDNGRGVFRFHVWPTNVDWSYEIEPADGGTRADGAAYGAAQPVVERTSGGPLRPRRRGRARCRAARRHGPYARRDQVRGRTPLTLTGHLLPAEGSLIAR